MFYSVYKRCGLKTHGFNDLRLDKIRHDLQLDLDLNAVQIRISTD